MTSSPPLAFTILSQSRRTLARAGRITTPHGSFDTPAFMPVGTRATVKGILPDLVAATGAQIVLANTYHLMLRPGADIIQRLGGLHRFMNWPGPILTDSGGYQAYSMADLNRITDDGVTFKSIIDGSSVTLTPERAIAIQNQLGPDIIMAFDDCPPSPSAPAEGVAESARPGEAGLQPRPVANSPVHRRRLATIKRDSASGDYDHPRRLREASDRTARWLERCRDAHASGPRAHDQSLFGIVQGGTDPAERTRCVDQVCSIDLPGYAIGGVAVGEESADIAAIVAHTAPLMPASKPRYLMGVGYERDLLAAVCAGVDMFDCVLPTRNGRNASAFTPTGPIRLRNAAYAEDPLPIEPGCDCAACRTTGFPARAPASSTLLSSPPSNDTPFTRAYIRHLFLAGEMLGPILVTLHNLRYFQRFMADLRRAIQDDDWAGLIRRWPAAAPGVGGMPALLASA